MKFLFLFAALFTLCHALSQGDYGPMNEGDGTYYGFTSGGNCANREPMPGMYDGMVPVAINGEQYGNSDACGACLLVTGTGRGSGANPITGTFKAYVMDRCGECKKGDIDLAKSGDGRWHVKWKFIPCPGQNVYFLFEGSNDFYWKLQPRGTKYPIQRIVIGGIAGRRTQDNFFEFHNGSGFKTPITVGMTDTMGNVVTARLTYFKADGPVYPSTSSGGAAPDPAPQQGEPGTSTFKNSSGRKPSGGSPPGRKPARCVPKFKACSGPKNYWKTSRCCAKNFRCVPASSSSFGSKRCEPKVRGKAKCVPRWGACTGPDNKWGTRRCCNGFVCRRPWRKSFRGKRCIPRRRR